MQAPPPVGFAPHADESGSIEPQLGMDHVGCGMIDPDCLDGRGVSRDNGDVAFRHVQQLGEEHNQRLVGLALFRRGGHRQLRSPVPFSHEARPGGSGNDLHRQQDAVSLSGHVKHVDSVHVSVEGGMSRLVG